MRSTEDCPGRVSAVAEPAQTGHAAAGSGQTSAGAVGVGMAVAGGAGEGLWQVLDGLRGGAGVRGFQAGIEAGQCVLGNRAFMHWVGALQSGGQGAVARGLPPCYRAGQALQKQGAPLQLMGKKKKQQQAPEVEEGSGKKAAGTEGDAGAGAEGKAEPGPDVVQPQATGTVPVEEPAPVEGAAGGGKKKKKKSRVQVALNTLRGEGVAAFGGYIEAEIGEAELLHTLAERITRAEDLKSVQAEALAVMGAGFAKAGGRKPKIAEIAPVKSELNRRELVLFNACIKGDAGQFIRFIRGGKADINIQNRGVTLLCGAAYLGQADIVEELLRRPDINVNLAPEDGATPLYTAVEQGHVKIVKLLLAKSGINANLAKLPDYATPLMIAVQRRHEQVVKLLLAVPEIDINLRKSDGATALFIAASQNFHGIVEQLLRRGADVNLGLSEGTTPLYTAIHTGNLEVARSLLQVPGIGVNLATSQGSVPLGTAARKGYKDIIRLLLRKGADPNIRNVIGLAPLHVACVFGHTDIVQILLHAGADMDAELDEMEGINYTPYSLAELGGHREVMSILAVHRRRSEAALRLEQLSITEEPGETAPSPCFREGQALAEAMSIPGTIAGEQTPRTFPEATEHQVTEAGAEDTGTPQAVLGNGVEGEADTDTARVCPVPPAPSPPNAATPMTQSPIPLEQAKDALRQEVLGKLRADNFDMEAGIRLLQEINATHSMDALCILYNRLAHIERIKERARRRKRRRETLHMVLGRGPAAADTAAAPVFTLCRKTGLDAEHAEVEIKRHLGQKYHRFVSQAVNDMEFGRGKRTTGYPGLWHVSAGVAGVGSCSVFYYLDAARNRIRIVGIGHHVGRAAYRLDYAAEELAGSGSVIRLS